MVRYSQVPRWLFAVPYIYIHMYMYVHTHVCTYIHTYIHTYIRTYIHTCMHAYILYIHACIHTYIIMQWLKYVGDKLWWNKIKKMVKFYVFTWSLHFAGPCGHIIKSTHFLMLPMKPKSVDLSYACLSKVCACFIYVYVAMW